MYFPIFSQFHLIDIHAENSEQYIDENSAEASLLGSPMSFQTVVSLFISLMKDMKIRTIWFPHISPLQTVSSGSVWHNTRRQEASISRLWLWHRSDVNMHALCTLRTHFVKRLRESKQLFSRCFYIVDLLQQPTHGAVHGYVSCLRARWWRLISLSLKELNQLLYLMALTFNHWASIVLWDPNGFRCGLDRCGDDRTKQKKMCP